MVLSLMWFLSISRGPLILLATQKLCKSSRPYGIKDLWLRDFLKNRTLTVKTLGSCSAPCAVVSGVPQGNILGPTLFLMFINDLADNIDSDCKMYADDVKICRSLADPVENLRLLQEDLNSLFGRKGGSFRYLLKSRNCCTERRYMLMELRCQW